MNPPLINITIELCHYSFSYKGVDRVLEFKAIVFDYRKDDIISLN